MSTNETKPLTLSDMPRYFTVIQPVFELQLGIEPTFILEVISMRTLKHKMVYDVKGEKRDYGRTIKAPSGYRISRAWRGSVTVENEIHIQNKGF